jgi:hypothetical protein
MFVASRDDDADYRNAVAQKASLPIVSPHATRSLHDRDPEPSTGEPANRGGRELCPRIAIDLRNLIVTHLPSLLARVPYNLGKLKRCCRNQVRSISKSQRQIAHRGNCTSDRTRFSALSLLLDWSKSSVDCAIPAHRCGYDHLIHNR